MKIGQKRSSQGVKASLGWVSITVILFAVGLFLGHRGTAAGIWERLSAPAELVRAILPVETPPTLAVDMRFANYDNLLQLREGANERGVYIPANRDYMTATMRLNSALVPVSMRFYPGPAGHLQGADRWNFDVRTRQNQQLDGMQRFYLLDPADNNWLFQHAFLRSLEREGILAPRYEFVTLAFNGDDWGVYAVLEGFGDELMTANGRTAGVILEFDADLLWESVAQFGDPDAAFADPVSNLLATDFHYFEIDAFRDATIADDEERTAQKEAGVSRLRALQAGEVAASEVFDVEKYGRFLALVDLWGAREAISLANLRYYFNPDTNLLEPIGFIGNPLSSQERLALAATYDDPVMQAAYTREAQRLSQPDYLVALQNDLGPGLVSLQRSLRAEAGELPLPWDAIARRQEQMRRSLNPLQPVFAHLGPPSLSMSATIQIDVANVINLPIEILGFDIDGLTFLEPDPSWLKTEAEDDLLSIDDHTLVLKATDSPAIRYVRFHLPITEIILRDKEIDFMQPIEIRVATRILGLETHQLTLARESASDQLIRP
jgi:hypothetical protein